METGRRDVIVEESGRKVAKPGRFRPCSRITSDEESGDEIDSGKESLTELVVARSYAAELLEFVEEAFHPVALPVKLFVVVNLLGACVDWRNHRLDSVDFQAFTDAIGIVTPIQSRSLQDIFGFQTFIEALELAAIVSLAWS